MYFYCFLILIGLAVLKGIFSSVQTSLSVLQIKKKWLQYKENDSKSKVIEKALNNYRNYWITINVVNLLIVFFSAVVIFHKIVIPVSNTLIGKLDLSPAVIEISVTLVTIFFSLYFFSILGGIIPERLAKHKPEEMLSLFLGIVHILYILFIPFILIVNVSSNIISIFFEGINSIYDDVITEEELLMMVEASKETGNIDENEKEMINNIFEFDNKMVGDISTHRKEIFAVSIDSSIDEILKSVSNEKYSRVPVYKDNIDNIIGILHIKDMLKYLVNHNINTIDLNSILMKPNFVPFSKKTDELFEEMQKKKIQMSIIIDEYGGTSGIVTMEDLIEEIMGNILDEYDDEEIPEIYYIEDQDAFIIDGTLDLETVSEHLNIELPVDEYDTISGFIIGQIGRIPHEEEKLKVEFENYIFKIEKMENKRISIVKVYKAINNEFHSKEEELKEE